MHPVSAPGLIDVALLTVLPEAYEAVRELFGLSEHETRNGYQWTWGAVGLRAGGRIFAVTGYPLDRENVAAATFVGAMLEAWRPKDLLLVDIGGAVRGRDDVKLGDVVVHTFLHYYDYHKVGEDGIDSARYLPVAPASTRLRELSRRPADRKDKSWIENISVKRPGAGEPKVLPGEMLVGGAIQSNSPRLRKLLDEYPKAIAVEMEGIGAGRAILDWSTRGPIPEFLIVRGMSDYCNVGQSRNQSTRERWRKYAATTAAAHAHALVREMEPRGLLPPPQPHRFDRPERRVENLWEAPHTIIRGRTAELELLRRRFTKIENGVVRKPHVVSGEAGMGKSVLARHIAAELASQYAAQWWVDASDDLKIRSGLREFALQLGIPSAAIDLSSEGDGSDRHRFLRDLREFLDQGTLAGRVMIILDNVDNAGVKRALHDSTLLYLPPTHCDVLITSQSNRWHPVAPTQTRLKGLDATSSTKLIAYDSGRFDLATNRDVGAICELFAGRPLFLKQVAALFRDGDDPAIFSRRLSESAESALEVLPENEGFDPLWERTYLMSIERADQARAGSRSLVEAMAYLSPEPIPLRVPRAIATGGNGWTQARIDAALATLTDRSLLERHREGESSSYTLHRVVGALVRMTAFKSGRTPAALAAATAAIHDVIPSRDLMRRPAGHRLMAPCAPHVEAITHHVLANRHAPLTLQVVEQAAEASSMLGLYRRTLSEWPASQEANWNAVTLSDTARAPAGAALRKVRLANILRQRGNFSEAQQLLSEALSTLREHGDGRDYAWGLTVQARVLRHRPDSAPDLALPLLIEALGLLRKFDSREDAATRRQLSELHGYISVVSRQLSKLDEAEIESINGLKIITSGMLPDQVLQATDLPEDALIATHLRALAGVWRLRGDLGRAMYALRQALAIFERVYGSNHADVCRALDTLGRIEREWGDLSGAIETFERARRISDLQFGKDYAHAGTAAVNLALAYLEQGESFKALEEAEAGLRIYRVAHKEGEQIDKPLRNEATVWAFFVRANVLAELGNLNEARKDHATILEWRQKRYPEFHAHTASSHYALGDVLWSIGELEPALSHHRQALSIRERVFGKSPNYWLAQSQARLGQLTKDIELLNSAQATFLAQLRPDHWRVHQVSAAIRELDETPTG
jgi:tetratricopeptide (TPR) repeat protein/nucleoside phosphorylase